jgi:hypothetical protein
MVYAGSPAEEAGIHAGDRITRIDETDIKSISDAIEAMNNLSPGSEVRLSIVRGDEPRDIKLTAARLPTSVPPELPPAYPVADEAEEKNGSRWKAGETGEVKLPEFSNKCQVYVPATRNDDQQLGVLVWLRASNETAAADVIERWKPVCDRDGVLLVVPDSTEASGWEWTELEYLLKLTVRVLADYKVDPRRVVVYGQEGGGTMAWLLGLSGKNVFRGIATSAARLPRQVKVPSNEQAQRLAIFAAVPSKRDGAGQITQSLQKLSEAGYPVTSISIAESSGELKDAQREELARWIDTLDRF